MEQKDNGTYTASGQRNIFLALTNKNLQYTRFIWLTDYTDSDNITPYTPQLVKLNDYQFLILWEEYDKTTRTISTKLVAVNADGEILDQTDTDIRLSDCQPIFTSSDTVCWYATDGESVQLYTVNPFHLTDTAATPAEESGSFTGFTDTTSTDYFYDAVAWAVEQGITTGTSDTEFSPEAACTRAQAVTFLWRAAGSPEVSGENPFADMSEDDYYYTAVLWALQNGITTGTSDDAFSPDATCTRAEIVTFLYRDMA